MAGSPPDPLAIRTSWPAAGVLLVALEGEADILSSSSIGRPLESVDDLAAVHVVFDLTGVTFIDSSGVNALVQAVRSVEAQDGSAVLACPSREVERVFEILDLAHVVRVESELDRALAPPAAPRDRVEDELRDLVEGET